MRVGEDVDAGMLRSPSLIKTGRLGCLNMRTPTCCSARYCREMSCRDLLRVHASCWCLARSMKFLSGCPARVLPADDVGLPLSCVGCRVLLFSRRSFPDRGTKVVRTEQAHLPCESMGNGETRWRSAELAGRDAVRVPCSTSS